MPSREEGCALRRPFPPPQLDGKLFHTPNRSDYLHRPHIHTVFLRVCIIYLYKFPRELMYRIRIICTFFPRDDL